MRSHINMLVGLFIVFVIVSYCDSLSIGTVSEKQNVSKREAKPGEFYPDWVPFKNKNGEQLGEFVQVEPKAKPKKRLAPPVNFVMKAVVEPEDDDYEDDDGEEDLDSDDVYEKGDWSDLHRAAQVEKTKPLNHTDISDIDGVVNIITNVKLDPITEALKNQNKKSEESVVKEVTGKTSGDNAEESKSEEADKEEKKKDADYQEESAEKAKPESNDQSESEAEKKARILDSVDQLKVRHAEEQRAISEKVKEEEEHERDTIISEDQVDKYDEPGQKQKKLDIDYAQHDDKDVSTGDKHKVNPKPKARQPKKGKRKGKKNKNVEEGKSSVFKNPQLFVVYDEETTEAVSTPRPRKSKTSRRPSVHTEITSTEKTSTKTPEKDESVRISLVPQESQIKEGEPTLFFPKKRKNKRRRKIKTTTIAPDSYVAETVEEKTAKDLISAPDTTVSDKSKTDTTATGSETAPSTAGSVTDAVPASSDHKKEQHEDYHREKGGGREYHSDHEEHHEEHGKKAYEGVHEDTKNAKGHHDKEKHHGKYEDQGGHAHHHEHETGHYGDHHHEEHGKKNAKYEESGKHAKGHSTKGSHDIHKKEEYEKNVEFFEEEGDSGEEEKHGGYNHEREHSSGGHFKKGNLDAGHHEHAKGDKGHFGKGGHAHGHKGHRSSGGHDSHGQRGHEHFEKENKDSGKKWVYHHGHPAKTANLVIIDRRADRYIHGPQYYG